MPPKNNRRHHRIDYAAPVRISWEERGEARFSMAKCVDISETGLRIESAYPVPSGATVMVAAERMNLSSAARIRHAVRRGGKHVFGLQLTQATLAKAMAQMEHRPQVTVVLENLNKVSL